MKDKKSKSKKVLKPTTNANISLIERMIEFLDLDRTKYAIPAENKKAVQLIKGIKEDYPGETFDYPTDKQLIYAADLKEITGLEFPKIKTKVAMREYIGDALDMAGSITRRQYNKIKKINAECAKFDNFVPFDINLPIASDDANTFIGNWINYLPPNDKDLKRANEIYKISNVPILTQFNEITQRSVRKYFNVWGEITGKTFPTNTIALSRVKSVVNDDQSFYRIRIRMEQEQVDLNSAALPVDEYFSIDEVYLSSPYQ